MAGECFLRIGKAWNALKNERLVTAGLPKNHI